MAKQRSFVADYLVYLVLRLFVCVIQALSWRQALAVARLLAWIAYWVDRRHRTVAHENLRHAFPHLAADERETLVRAVYQHFGTMLVEIMQMPRLLSARTWRRHMELPQGRLFVEWCLQDRPLMFVLSHFGNWELGGYIMGLLGFPVHAIARPLDNRFAEAYLRRWRERTGGKILAKKGDFERMDALLAHGGRLATLADQDAGARGPFVEFFGRPASTHKAVALLSLEHSVPLLVIGVRRLGAPMRYQMVVEDVILPEEYHGQPDAVRAMTQRFTTAIERLVRRSPEQYFWLHRRWKHQPTSRKQRQAA
ncbi:MAG: hypothetical protein NZ700_11720 [Gemmataceae bacterium]|nr:hypothetical protein [Gemmataceae bacterium]MDW8266832.1 hypothetical protein [Gemmataceae bacterium]